jgi:hypothetical protein
MGDTFIFPESLLESRDPRTGPDPPTFETGHDLVDLFLLNVRGAENQESFPRANG